MYCLSFLPLLSLPPLLHLLARGRGTGKGCEAAVKAAEARGGSEAAEEGEGGRGGGRP